MGGGGQGQGQGAKPRDGALAPSARGRLGVSGFCLTSWNDSLVLLLSRKPTGLVRVFPSSRNSVSYKINWIRWCVIHLH